MAIQTTIVTDATQDEITVARNKPFNEYGTSSSPYQDGFVYSLHANKRCTVRMNNNGVLSVHDCTALMTDKGEEIALWASSLIKSIPDVTNNKRTPSGSFNVLFNTACLGKNLTTGETNDLIASLLDGKKIMCRREDVPTNKLRKDGTNWTAFASLLHFDLV